MQKTLRTQQTALWEGVLALRQREARLLREVRPAWVRVATNAYQMILQYRVSCLRHAPCLLQCKAVHVVLNHADCWPTCDKQSLMDHSERERE